MAEYKKYTYGWFLEHAKKDGFDNLKDWNKWRADSGRLPKNKISKEYRDRKAQELGYLDDNERKKEWKWSKGLRSPMSENEYCTNFLGNVLFENIIEKIFGNFKRMPHGNQGFDYICEKGYKIDCKAACLDKFNKWKFNIKYNNRTDYFLLGAFDSREDKNLIHLWLIHKDEIIRKGYNHTKEKLWKREALGITNKDKYIVPFKKYEVTDKLENFKECLDKLKEENKI